MGEYGKVGGHEVKIGTCENMYYLRYEDRHRVQPMSGSVDPSREIGLRFRLPFPDEDHVGIGSYEPYQRGLRLYRQPDPNGYHEDFHLTTADPGTIQLHHDCGLLVNVQCFHGERLPDDSPHISCAWNGKAWFWELFYVKTTAEGVKPIIGCRHCRTLYRVEWSDIWNFIPEGNLKTRLAVHQVGQAAAIEGDTNA